MFTYKIKIKKEKKNIYIYSTNKYSTNKYSTNKQTNKQKKIQS